MLFSFFYIDRLWKLHVQIVKLLFNFCDPHVCHIIVIRRKPLGQSLPCINWSLAARMARNHRKLGNLTPGSTYCPVASYPLPRGDFASTTGTISHKNSQCTFRSSSSGRESCRLEDVEPQLKDLNGSEDSMDDNSRYHALVADLWDSFWSQSTAPKSSRGSLLPPVQRFPSPTCIDHPNKQLSVYADEEPLLWHSPNDSSLSYAMPLRTKKPAATQSTNSQVPHPSSVKSSPPSPIYIEKEKQSATSCGKSLRPPRRTGAFATPRIEQPPFAPVKCFMSDQDQKFGQDFRMHHPKPTLPSRKGRSRIINEESGKSRAQCTIYLVISHSNTHLPVPEVRPSPSRTSCRRQIDQEPHSVFEDDSRSKEHHRMNFVRFYKALRMNKKMGPESSRHNRSRVQG